MMLDLLILAMAVHQAVNVLRFSALFAGLRNWIEMDCPVSVPVLCKFVPRWFLKSLHDCPWCLSVHLAFWFGLFYAVPGCRYVVYVLAVSQAANLLHHLFNHRGPKLN